MKILFVTLGFIFLGLGVLGIYLPLIPYTPFLILATICFGKGSDKFNNWFVSTNLYKNNIQVIKENKGMEISQKIKIVSTITIFFGISFYFIKNLHGRVALITIWLIHIICLFFIVKTKRREKNV